MARIIYFVLLFSFGTAALEAQEQTRAELPRTGRLLFQPLAANFLEPRIGLTRLVQEQRLRLDIGNSVDILIIEGDAAASERAAIGADFFTWTSLRQTANFHFPVDVVDYLFGANVAYERNLNREFRMSGRFRWSHISAHSVDGSYDKSAQAWSNGALPRVYSREFFELIAAVTFMDMFRVYGGGQYLYHTDPVVSGKVNIEYGVEFFKTALGFSWMQPYAAYDCKLLNTGVFVASHSVQAGVKCGSNYGSDINIFIAWYQGMSQHGEYYDKHWSYWGPGFTVDF